MPLKKLAFAISLLNISAYANVNVYQSNDKHRTIIVTNQTINNATLIDSVPNIEQKSQNNTRIYHQSQPTTQSYTPALGVVSPNAEWPSIINYNANFIEFANSRTLGSLLQKWRQGGNISIAHFGDSHIQTGWQVSSLRQAFQSAKGNGGRGMIFPYKIAKTYSQDDYDSTFTGSWRTANSMQQPPKLGVGISGFVAKTTDNWATVNFNFKESAPSLGNVRANLMFIASGDYDITISNGTSSKTVAVTASSRTQQLLVDLPNSHKSLQISISKKSGGEFEFHGLNLLNPAGGLVYHNLGVGGAAFKALLQQKYFDEQIAMIAPDLVILDWGTNDILYQNTIAPDFESTVRQTIAKVRRQSPNAAILLASTQETRYRKSRTTSAAELSTLLRTIAQSEGVLFYDWYTIAGGVDATAKWHSAGYASKDHIHLNGKGYRVRGQLLAAALMGSLNSY